MLSILRDPQLLQDGVAKRRLYGTNDTVINEGSIGRTLYLIERGRVRVSGRVELENKRHIQPGLCDLEPDDVFGELSLFEDAPRSASVVAVQDCELLEFRADALVAHFDNHPERGYLVLKTLFNILTTRLRQADRRLASIFAWGLKVHGINEHL